MTAWPAPDRRDRLIIGSQILDVDTGELHVGAAWRLDVDADTLHVYDGAAWREVNPASRCERCGHPVRGRQ